MPIAPATLTNPPTSPDRSDPNTFSARAVALDDYTKNVHVPEMQAAITNVYNNAVEANVNAVNAAASAVSAVAGANFKGNWLALTGALNMPASVAHNGSFWALNTNLANVTTATPGVSASWTSMNVGAGGALEASGAVDITLTNLSFKVQSVTMTVADKSVTLPSATGLPAGGELFVIKNSGSIAFAVRSNGGKMLTQLDGGQTAMLYLANVSTAAGVWVVGHVDDPQLVQSLYQATATTVNAVASSRISITKMSSTQAIAAWSVSTGMVACTLNLTGNSVSAGAVLAVSAATGPQSVAVTALSATQAVVVTQGASGYLSGYTLNVSGTTLTAGALLTVNAVSSSFMAIDAVSSTQALVVFIGTTSQVSACTLNVSGTTLTNGAIAAVGANATDNLSVAVLSATQAIVVYRLSSSVNAMSIQLSGTTATYGPVCSPYLTQASGGTAIEALSATEALVSAVTTNGLFTRIVSVIAGNVTESGLAFGVSRSSSTSASMKLTRVSSKSFAVLDVLEANSSSSASQIPRVQMLGLKDSALKYGLASAIKNSNIATNYADIAAMDDTKILAVYLEPSGFVQARVLEIGA